MKISQEDRDALYAAIRETIVRFRIAEKFDANLDFRVCQLESRIWDKMKTLFEKPTPAAKRRGK